jgi:hypothetical protein
MAMWAAMFDAIDSVTDAANSQGGGGKRRRRGRHGGPVSGMARQRLMAAGVEVDDVERSAEGRRRKAAGREVGPGLRDGPGLPLRNLKHETAARNYAAGLPERDAWVFAGYAPSSLDYLRVMREPDFLARVAEFRKADAEHHGVSLPFLQQRLLRMALSDPGDYFELVPHTSGRYRVKDLASLSPELRSCIAEVSFDKQGRPVVKLHDRSRALAELARMLTPVKTEVSGPGGGPVLLDALLSPAALQRLSDDEIQTLNLIAHKIAADDESTVVDAEAVEVEPDASGGG